MHAYENFMHIISWHAFLTYAFLTYAIAKKIISHATSLLLLVFLGAHNSKKGNYSHRSYLDVKRDQSQDYINCGIIKQIYFSYFILIMREDHIKDRVEDPFADSSEVGRGQSKWQRWIRLHQEDNYKGAKLLFKVVLAVIVGTFVTAVIIGVIIKLALNK